MSTLPLCTALPKPSQLPPPKDRCFSVPIHHGSLTSGEETPREAGEIVAVNGCSGVHHIASPCIDQKNAKGVQPWGADIIHHSLSSSSSNSPQKPDTPFNPSPTLNRF